MKNKFRTTAFQFVFSLCFIIAGLSIHAPRVLAASDLDDVETDVDSVTSESDAAQSEAQDEQKRAEREKENLVKAKKAARAAENEAQTKGAAAKKEINALDATIHSDQKLRAKFENDKAWALKVIAKAQARVAKKKEALAKANAEVTAAKAERDVQNKNIENLKNEEKTTADTIAADRLERDKLAKEITALKQKQTEMQARLEKQRQTAHHEADMKDKLKAEQEATKRKISSIPNKVIVRSPKFNCDVTETAGDGALKIGAIKPGTKYDLYRVINGRWVELQYGTRTAFAAKTCF